MPRAALQGLGVVVLSAALSGCEEPWPPPPAPDSGSPRCDVAALFAQRCLSNCHDSATRQGGLDLESSNWTTRAYDTRAAGRADYLLIDPEIPEESALLAKLFNAPPFGARMPLGGAAFTADERACVRVFLEQVVASFDGGHGLDGGPADSGTGSDGGPGDGGTPPDAGSPDAGQFWGPVVGADNCVPDGGRWCIERTVSEPLYAVRGSAANDVWAVGARGAIWHRDDTSWSRHDAGVDLTLFDVHPVSATEVWAVGERGTVLRFDGSGWSAVPWSTSSVLDAGLLPNGQPTWDLGGAWVQGGEAWFAGGGGTLAQYSSGALRVVHTSHPNRPDPDLIRMWARGPDEWWAAGDLSIREKTDAGWRPGRGALSRAFGVWGALHPTTGARILLTVGADGSMLRYDYNDPGTYPWQPPNWTAERLELKRDLRSIWLSAGATGWTVGLDGQIVEVDAATRQYKRHLTPTGDHLLGVWGASATQVWAVGGRQQGIILKLR